MLVSNQYFILAQKNIIFYTSHFVCRCFQTNKMLNNRSGAGRIKVQCKPTQLLLNINMLLDQLYKYLIKAAGINLMVCSFSILQNAWTNHQSQCLRYHFCPVAMYLSPRRMAHLANRMVRQANSGSLRSNWTVVVLIVVAVLVYLNSAILQKEKYFITRLIWPIALLACAGNL